MLLRDGLGEPAPGKAWGGLRAASAPAPAPTARAESRLGSSPVTAPQRLAAPSWEQTNGVHGPHTDTKTDSCRGRAYSRLFCAVVASRGPSVKRPCYRHGPVCAWLRTLPRTRHAAPAFVLKREREEQRGRRSVSSTQSAAASPSFLRSVHAHGGETRASRAAEGLGGASPTAERVEGGGAAAWAQTSPAVATARTCRASVGIMCRNRKGSHSS